jgi:transposase
VIQVTPQMRIRVALMPVDFRRGIDGLARLCQADLKEDPFRGTVFVFRNKRSTAIKVLVYDGQGFWLCQKRWSSGSFRHWPETDVLASHEFIVLLAGGDPKAAKGTPMWKPVSVSA